MSIFYLFSQQIVLRFHENIILFVKLNKKIIQIVICKPMQIFNEVLMLFDNDFSLFFFFQLSYYGLGHVIYDGFSPNFVLECIIKRLRRISNCKIVLKT